LRIEDVAWSAQRIPKAVNLGFLDRSRYFLEIAPQYPHEAEWTPFQTHYFSGNVVATGIEPLDLTLEEFIKDPYATILSCVPVITTVL
jgi:hypothetical protein